MATAQIKQQSTAATSAGTGWPKTRSVNSYENRIPSSATSLSINRPINL